METGCLDGSVPGCRAVGWTIRRGATGTAGPPRGAWVMRHGRAGYRLGRTTAHRASTLRNIAAGLFEHGQIVTTIPKAKAVKPMVEKIITAAKTVCATTCEGVFMTFND